MQTDECLRAMFEDKNASLNSISRLSGINKGTLSRIVYGKQDVKFDELMKISSALGLLYGQQKLLLDTYFNEMYGKKDMDAVHFVLEEIPTAFDPPDVDVPDRGYTSYPENGFLPDMKSVYEAIFTVTDIESGKIYTDFPFENKVLDEFFFRKAKKEGIELFHFIKNIHKDGEKQNLHSLIRALRYMNIGQFPYATDEWQFTDDMNILPYFCATQKGAVLFNGEFGFVTVNGDSAADIIKKAERMLSRAECLGKKPADIMDIKNFSVGLKLDGGVIDICKYPPCLAKYVTREMMYSAAKDVPNKDSLIDICCVHYGAAAENENIVGFLTLPGLEDFAATGNFYGIPPEFVNGFPREVRIEILNAIKKDFAAGKLYLLSRADAIPDGLTIEVDSEKVCVYGTDTSVPQFCLCSEFFFELADPFCVKLMRIAKEILISCGGVYGTAAAARVADNCIALAANDMRQSFID